MTAQCLTPWWLLLLLLPCMTSADPAPWSLLQDRFRQPGAAEFRYEETHTLELMAAPWHGQGYMLSAADGSLVKLQLAPQRVIMAISGGRMYYFDAEQRQRRSASLSYAGQAQEQIAAFRAILQGQVDELRALYDLSAIKHGENWKLRLAAKTKPSGSALESIEISGGTDERKRQILIRQADGESTEYRLEKTGEGQSLEFSVQRLLQEAAGE